MKKSELLQYLGPVDNLVGYQRSYKLVFFMSLLETMDTDGLAQTKQVATKFRDFYIDRAMRGLPPDYNVTSTIKNIQESSLSSVLWVIKDNPYQSFAAAKIVSIQSVDNQEMFALESDLAHELSDDDKREIKDILNNKLEYYYSIAERSLMSTVPTLREAFIYIMDNYQQSRATESFSGNKMHSYFSQEAKNAITSLPTFNTIIHSYRGAVGQGNWAAVPWIAVFDKRITDSAKKGVYLCYLFSNDGNYLFLTLMQGTTDILTLNKQRKGYEILRNNAGKIRNIIQSHDFGADTDILMGNRDYEVGTVYYKRYEKNRLPENATLESDFAKMIDILDQYYNSTLASNDRTPNTEGLTSTNQPNLNNHSEILSQIKRYISSRGFTYPSDLVENFYLSIKSKPFIILAGISGTGKTRFIRLFAEAVGATPANGNFMIIPVRPDWSDSSDLLGHTDLNGRFVPGLITDFVAQAIQNPERPFFLCLDEMNLARVEYYLSDILSIMESRCRFENGIKTDQLIRPSCFGIDSDARDCFGELYLPPNLILIGTVNMDETTFAFSKKVLDRANTIEFSHIDLKPKEKVLTAVEQLHISSEFLESDYLTLADCEIDEGSIIHDVVDLLTEINVHLEPINAQIGYRVRDEICFYVLYNERFKLLDFNSAKDLAIKQKILPRIAGSNQSIRDTLIGLFKLCVANSAIDLHPDNPRNFEVMQQYLKDKNAANASVARNGVLYPQSAHKIAFMMRRLEEDGFTTYWL